MEKGNKITMGSAIFCKIILYYSALQLSLKNWCTVSSKFAEHYAHLSCDTYADVVVRNLVVVR